MITSIQSMLRTGCMSVMKNKYNAKANRECKDNLHKLNVTFTPAESPALTFFCNLSLQLALCS